MLISLTTDTLRRYDEDTISDEERAEQTEYDKYCYNKSDQLSPAEKNRNMETCLELTKKRFPPN